MIIQLIAPMGQKKLQPADVIKPVMWIRVRNHSDRIRIRIQGSRAYRGRLTPKV